MANCSAIFPLTDRIKILRIFNFMFAILGFTDNQSNSIPDIFIITHNDPQTRLIRVKVAARVAAIYTLIYTANSHAMYS